MTPAWAQRREEILSDCLVSPDVFHQMVDRLGEFVVPYQHTLETEANQRNVPLYLQGLLSHLPRKNAEKITFHRISWWPNAAQMVKAAHTVIPCFSMTFEQRRII
jgi:hypothetical protein